MSIKKMYYYLFYKLYKHYENSSQPWLSNWKAGASIGVLEIWLLLSIGNYFLITTDKTIHLNLLQPIVIVPVTIVFIFNYLSFDYKDTWKKYNKEFDQLSKDQNKKGGVIVWSIIIIIITNMIFRATKNKRLHRSCKLYKRNAEYKRWKVIKEFYSLLLS